MYQCIIHPWKDDWSRCTGFQTFIFLRCFLWYMLYHTLWKYAMNVRAPGVHFKEIIKASILIHFPIIYAVDFDLQEGARLNFPSEAIFKMNGLISPAGHS